MRKDLTIAAVMWLVVTVASLAVTYFVIAEVTFPTRGAEEADVIDRAFLALTYMAAPVFGLVIAALAYSLSRFRVRGTPDRDGPALLGHGAVPLIWLAATSALALVVMIYPGLTGLFELRSNNHADMQVNVTGMRWQWVIEYPEQGVRMSGAQEMVLPVDRRVRFNITSLDVLHSFWVPAFRVKLDAVPGQTNVLYATPDRVSERDDIAYRLVCAELCGLFHSGMRMSVRVVERAEFEQWLVSQRQAAEAR